ncbi:MAG TPA: hypothetical protein DCZ20_07365, partial [Lachnospiraceae bacterium]|nr:hypothetical protein [Lachnospiraceae bacterium]
MYHFLLYFFIYGFLGWCTEVAFAAFKEKRFVNRGFLNGPICPVYGFGVGIVVSLLQPFASNLILLYLISTVVVTVLEWFTGFLLEKLFHSRWWDYSDMPLNLNGYVCLLFSLIWGVACVFIVKIFHPLIVTLTNLLPHSVGIVLILLLGIVLFADLYVTASGILKLNRRLESMEQIAQELHSISDEIGENIYRNVIETLEFSEEKKQKLQERLEETTQSIQEKRENISDDISERILELKRRYRELTDLPGHTNRRLLKAFPRMHSLTHHEALKDIQEHLKN